MQAISMKALSSPSSASGLASRNRRSSRQPTRTVTASATKGNEPEKSEEQAPNKFVMSAVGAMAAVGLALGGPVYAQDPLPNSAESQSARDEVNRETSSAPSLTDIGKNFTQNVLGGGGGDAGEAAKGAAQSAANKAKNAAPDLSSADPLPDSAESQGARNAVNRETSDAPSLTDIGKNFTQNVLGGGGGDVAKAGKDVANKAKNATPDLSDTRSFERAMDKGIFDRASTNFGKVLGEAGQAQKPFPDALTNLGKQQSALREPRKVKQATAQVTSQGADAAKKGAEGAKKGAEGAARKAKNAAPDVSQLPDFGGLVDKVQGKVASDVDTAKGKVTSDVGTAKGKVQSDISTVKGKVKSDIGTAKNAAPDLSQLPDFGGIADKIQGKVTSDVDTVKGKVTSDVGTAKGKVQSDIGTAKGKVKSDIGTAKNAAPDLSQLPDFGGLADKIQGKVASDVSTVQGKVTSDVGTAKGKVQSDIGTAKGKVKSDIGTAKNAAPDLSQLPNLSGLADKIQGKVSSDVDTAKGKVTSDVGTAKGKVQSDIGTVKGKVKSDIGTAKNAAPDLSTAELPDGNSLFRRMQGRENTFDALQRAADKAGSQVPKIKSQAKKATSDVASKGSKVGAKAQNAASTAKGKVKNAAPDLSFNPLDLIGNEPQNAAKDAQNAASELQSTGGQNFKAGGGKPKQEEGKQLKKDYQQGSSDLPVPDVGSDVDTGK